MLNANAEKKEKTRREYMIFFVIILILVVIVQISDRISTEIPKPAPTTIVEEQIPSVPSVVEETPERQDVLSCEFAEIRKHCNSGVLSELEMTQTLKVIDERRQFPHYGKNTN